jgi:hypothetical protein
MAVSAHCHYPQQGQRDQQIVEFKTIFQNVFVKKNHGTRRVLVLNKMNRNIGVPLTISFHPLTIQLSGIQLEFIIETKILPNDIYVAKLSL